VDKIYSILDYSYRSTHCAGDGFILIGDAYGFLDPIYSSGVLLALKMAELAADSIHEAFQNNDFSAARLGQYQAKLDQGIESMRKLVYAFYNEGFSFSQFLQKYPDQRVNIITLLMGDVFKEGVDNIYEPMADFAIIPPPLYEQLNGQPVPTQSLQSHFLSLRSCRPSIRPLTISRAAESGDQSNREPYIAPQLGREDLHTPCQSPQSPPLPSRHIFNCKFNLASNPSCRY
jgi:hypothetical protein